MKPKHLFMMIQLVLLLCTPSLGMTYPTPKVLSFQTETTGVHDDTCSLVLRATASFECTAFNCASGGSCDPCGHSITVTGPGSPYTLLSSSTVVETWEYCSEQRVVGAITTRTQEYLVPPLSKISAEAKLWHTCGGVTYVVDTETLELWTQSLNEDGDAYTVCNQQDCDDGDPAIHAGAVEICDGIDNDCDGIIDNSGVDQDADGSDSCHDCDDNDPSKKPGEDLDGDLVDSCTDCNDDPLTGALAQSLQASIIGGATVTAVPTSRFGLGAGWTHSFNLSLSREGDGAVSIQSPTGRDINFYPDASGNLSTATNSAGETTTYNYQDSNDPHNLTSIQNDAGQTVLNVQYDTLDRAIAVDVGAGGANGLTISYDAPGQCADKDRSIGHAASADDDLHLSP